MINGVTRKHIEFETPFKFYFDPFKKAMDQNCMTEKGHRVYMMTKILCPMFILVGLLNLGTIYETLSINWRVVGPPLQSAAFA